VVERDGKQTGVSERRVVVLACGGIPHHIACRTLFSHEPTGKEHYSPGPSGNTGDSLRLAEAVGGKVDTSWRSIFAAEA
jgi:hypothetical protein